MCIQLKPLFSRHKGIGVQFTDEPTGNLDEENTKNVMELLTGLNENGMGIILVTHDPYAASFAKRKYVLEHGVLKEERNRN